jgi:2'-5' RNA ligase
MATRQRRKRSARVATEKATIGTGALEDGGKLHPAKHPGPTLAEDLKKPPKLPKVRMEIEEEDDEEKVEQVVAKQIKNNPNALFFFVRTPEKIRKKLSGYSRVIAADFKGVEVEDVDHVTLLYVPLKEGAKIDEKEIAKVASKTLRKTRAVQAKIQGWGYFDGAEQDGEKKTALVALVDSPGLAEIHVALKKALVEAGIPADDQIHGFVPHTTIAYLGRGSRAKPLPELGFDFNVDQVEMTNESDFKFRLKNIQKVEFKAGMDVESKSTPELKEVHFLLHRAWFNQREAAGRVKPTMDHEEMTNLHARVVDELFSRGVKHPAPPDFDLDEMSEDFEENFKANIDHSAKPVFKRLPRRDCSTVKVECSPSGGKALVDLVDYIRTTGNIGHSFSILVDPENKDFRKSFGWDGDGSDSIQKVSLYEPKLKVADVQANKPASEDKLELGKFFNMPKATMVEGEQTVERFVELYQSNDWFPALVQKKFDGVRHQIHKDGDQVKILAEDGTDNTRKLPMVAQEIRELKVDRLVLDAVVEAWDRTRHLPREDVVAYLGAKTEPDDSNIVANIFDALVVDEDIHNAPIEDRLEALKMAKIAQSTQTHPNLRMKLNLVPGVIVDDASELEGFVRALRMFPGSKGVIVKRLGSPYVMRNYKPETWVKFENEEIHIGKQADPFLEIPEEKRRFTVHKHFQGAEARSELRLELEPGKSVIGWTLKSKPVEEPVTTMTKAKEQTEEWLTKRASSTEPKPPVPWNWLNVEGVSKTIGASDQGPGVFHIVERGEVQFGVQKRDLHEYFLNGATNCRLVIRRSNLKVEKNMPSRSRCMRCNEAKPVVDVLWADGRGRAWFCKACFPKWKKEIGEWGEIVGVKETTTGEVPKKWRDIHKGIELDIDPHITKSVGGEGQDWVAARMDDPTPFVLSPEAVKEGWTPPPGVSALPSQIRDQVPEDFRFWLKKDAQATRDALVEAIVKGEVKVDFNVAPEPYRDPERAQTTKREDDVRMEIPILKIDADKRIVTGVVLEPDEVDAHNDTVAEEVIEAAAHRFLARYNQETELGVMHKIFGNVGLELYESWVTKVQQIIGGQPVKKGSWVMTVHVLDESRWKDIKAGKITGFSIGGVATVV